jgi:hypothetical protein
MHTGAMDGYVEISAGGVQNRNLGRTAQLVQADNVCPFNKWGEAAFRQVVEVIRHQLYARPGQAGQAAPTASNIPQQIADLARLHDAGALSNAEFEAKKSELLARM